MDEQYAYIAMMMTMKRQNLLKTIYPVIALYFYSFFIQTNNDDDGIILQFVHTHTTRIWMSDVENGKIKWKMNKYNDNDENDVPSSSVPWPK